MPERLIPCDSIFLALLLRFRQRQHPVFRLDAAHPVYAGHFPGNPVLPGVCTLQIVRECLERGTGRRHRFTAIRECKFLGMIVPQADTLLDIDIRLADDGTAAKKVTCVVTNNEKTVLKLKATATPKP